MLIFTVALDYDKEMVLSDDSEETLSIVIKDDQGNAIARGHINKNSLKTFAKAL